MTSWLSNENWVDLEARTRLSISRFLSGDSSSPRTSNNHSLNNGSVLYHDNVSSYFDGIFEMDGKQKMLGFIISLISGILFFALSLFSLSSFRISLFLFFFSISNTLIMFSPFWIQKFDIVQSLKSVGLWVYLLGLITVAFTIVSRKGIILLTLGVCIQFVGSMWYLFNRVPILQTFVSKIIFMFSWMYRLLF